MQAGMDARCRLADHHGPAPRAGGQLDQLRVAVHEAGRRIEQVNQGGLVGGKLKRRQHAQRHLLVTSAEPRPGASWPTSSRRTPPMRPAPLAATR